MRELLAATCLLIGCWWVYRSGRAILRGVQSRTWPRTTGRIIKAKLERRLDSEGDEIVRESLQYSYSVSGKPYRGTRRRFGVPPKLEWNHAWTRSSRRGEQVEVIYSPRRPSVCALQRGFSPVAGIPLTAGGFLVWIGVRLLF